MNEREWVEQLYEVRIEPDKLLIMITNRRQQLKNAAALESPSYHKDRPVEPAHTWEDPEAWAAIAEWEAERAGRAEAALKDALAALSIRGVPEERIGADVSRGIDVLETRYRKDINAALSKIAALKGEVRPKEGHDVQYPRNQWESNPALMCKCVLHPVPPELEAMTDDAVFDGAAVEYYKQLGLTDEEIQRLQERRKHWTLIGVATDKVAAEFLKGSCLQCARCGSSDAACILCWAPTFQGFTEKEAKA